MSCELEECPCIVKFLFTERRDQKILTILMSIKSLYSSCILMVFEHFLKKFQASRKSYIVYYIQFWLNLHTTGRVTVNSNMANLKFHLIRSFFEIFARFLSFDV